MKRTISLMLVAMLLIACMTVTAFAAKAGETVTVTLTATGSEPFTDFTGNLSYDTSALTVTGTAVGGGFGYLNGSKINWATTGDVTSAGVFSLSVTIAPNAEHKTYTISGASTSAYNQAAEAAGTVSLYAQVTVECDYTFKSETVDPTCTTGGYTRNYCSCGKYVDTAVTPATGHNWSNWNVTAEADCVTAGSQSRTCQNGCGEAETQTIPALGHKAAAAVKENEVKATCTTDGSYEEVVYCSVCGVEMSRSAKTVGKLGHTPAAAVKENEVKATCQKAGSYDEVVYCSVCGAEISRTAKTVAKLAHTPAAAVKENVVEATCDKAGSYDEVVYCSVCGEEISRNKVTVPATGDHKGTEIIINKDGTHTIKCECGHIVVENQKHADKNNDGKCDTCGEKVDNGSNDNDDEGENDTGDITPYPVFFLMAVMAVMGTAYGFKRFAK